MGRVIELAATAGSMFLCIITLPFSLFFCFKIVQEYERAVIFRLGRLRAGGARGPGTFFILPCIDDYYPIDLRTVCMDVPPQEVLTKDSVTVTVDAVTFYRVTDPLSSVINVTNYRSCTLLLAMTTLRTVLGTKTLAELLSHREQIAQTLQIQVDEGTGPWGVQVERIEITDVRLPMDMQRAMAAEAEAGREARAKVLSAEGELKASKTLQEAANVITKSPAALQLRYLQTLSTISVGNRSIVVFPLPIDLLQNYF